ncbi:MAG: NAD-dependent epimerase/dehydratase [Candidatus Peregrinibacteria bacterium GW2011_GWA2_43_8]|nr:MAG: NAD-dependent epimerase/dehydratase [Candidatus Peregrinibacteria bacterium GW2011_GWA2_43_8]
MPKALITGITGQDGSYLAEFLLGKGYEVFGLARRCSTPNYGRISHLLDKIEIVDGDLLDTGSLIRILSEVKPDEVYNLAGQSSVGLSFEQPVETLESISIGTLNLLEGIRFLDRDIRLYSAGSSECFGNSGDTPCNESSPFRPRSPYAIAKAAAPME